VDHRATAGVSRRGNCIVSAGTGDSDCRPVAVSHGATATVAVPHGATATVAVPHGVTATVAVSGIPWQ